MGRPHHDLAPKDVVVSLGVGHWIRDNGGGVRVIGWEHASNNVADEWHGRVGALPASTKGNRHNAGTIGGFAWRRVPPNRGLIGVCERVLTEPVVAQVVDGGSARARSTTACISMAIQRLTATLCRGSRVWLSPLPLRIRRVPIDDEIPKPLKGDGAGSSSRGGGRGCGRVCRDGHGASVRNERSAHAVASGRALPGPRDAPCVRCGS